MRETGWRRRQRMREARLVAVEGSGRAIFFLNCRQSTSPGLHLTIASHPDSSPPPVIWTCSSQVAQVHILPSTGWEGEAAVPAARGE